MDNSYDRIDKRQETQALPNEDTGTWIAATRFSKKSKKFKERPFKISTLIAQGQKDLTAPKDTEILSNSITQAYEEIVHFRKNSFELPSGKAGKGFIMELTQCLKQFNMNAKVNHYALKALMVLPALLLQKPSAKSKAKDHTSCLTRR